MQVAGGVFNPCFTEWLGNMLEASRPYTEQYLGNVVNNSRFGLDVSALNEKHRFYKRFMFFVIMTYYRAWDYHTWHAPTNEDNCKESLPLGAFVEDKTIQCLLKMGDCMHFDIRPLLRIAGIRPLPDGISVMQIQANDACNSILFQVNKERRTDFPDIQNINML